MATSALYSASDFPALAVGVDPGLAGEAAVSVWAPSQDEWSLTSGEVKTITLKLRSKPGDPTPAMADPGHGQARRGSAAQDRRRRTGGAEETRAGGQEEDAVKPRRSNLHARCPRCCD